MPNQTKWYGERVQANVTKISLRKLRRVGRGVANKVKENIAVPGPAPSAQGEYPHKQTGELQAKIDYRMDLPNTAVYVIAGADHAKYLENKSPESGGRPFLSRTLREMSASGEIQAMFDKS